MRITGKILFYNGSEGEGIIITQDKNKYRFSVTQWSDFEVMPAVGLKISFELYRSIPQNIEVLQENVSLEEELLLEDKREDSHFLNDEELIIKPQRYKEEELTISEEELVHLLTDTSLSLLTLDENIQQTMSITDTMKRYFRFVSESIKKRLGYKKVDGRLDYRLAKRFLWTTYNNLREIDSHIITERIKSVSEDLRQMDKLQEDYERKVRYPSVAFEEIFLSSQIEYRKTKIIAQKVSDKLSSLRVKEHSLGLERKKLQKKIDKLSSSKEKEALEKQHKIVSGTYVDIIHMIAKLQEVYSVQMEKLQRFEEKYQEVFNQEFKKEAKRYGDFIVDIVNAQAYLLDYLLWKEAKTSKAILVHFKNLAVDVELNTKGYLKYYLSTLDESKATESTKELYELYQHLQDIHKDYVLIVCDDVQDAIEYEQCIRSISQNLGVKTFIDELQALKWAMTNSVKVIIVTQTLQLSSAQKFLDSYHNNIFSKPEIILLGDAPHKHSKHYSIRRILPRNSSTRDIVQSLKAILGTSQKKTE